MEENASLLNILLDQQRQLNNLVEEYGNLLTGNEENVVNLGTEVKELWEKVKKSQEIGILYYDGSEEQKEEANRQESIVDDLKDGIFATLFNAKY